MTKEEYDKLSTFDKIDFDIAMNHIIDIIVQLQV